MQDLKKLPQAAKKGTKQKAKKITAKQAKLAATLLPPKKMLAKKPIGALVGNPLDTDKEDQYDKTHETDTD